MEGVNVVQHKLKGELWNQRCLQKKLRLWESWIWIRGSSTLCWIMSKCWMKAKYKIVEWQYDMNIILPCVPVWWLFSVPMYKWHQSTYWNKHLSVEDKREWAHPLDNHWKSRTYWGHNISQRKITLLYYSQYHPVGQVSTEFCWWPFSERPNMTHLDTEWMRWVTCCLQIMEKRRKTDKERLCVSLSVLDSQFEVYSTRKIITSASRAFNCPLIFSSFSLTEEFFSHDMQVMLCVLDLHVTH